MSLRAILDVIINFDSFRNIDIYQQGLYNIKVTICQKINGDEYFASPYNLLTKESDKDESRVLEAEIDEIAFTSRSFLIRYNDEEIALNEICLFRMELDHDHLTRNTDIYLKASLMHLSTENLNDNDIMQLSSHKIAEFQSLSNLEIQLKNAVYGINQFYPFVFENQHFCVFSATIHTMLIDFRLRNARLEDTKAHLKHCEIDLANFISQFYFENRSRVGQTEIDEIYNLFVMLLENSYNNNKALISSWVNHAPSTQDNTLKDIIAQTSDEMVVFPKEDLTTNQVIDRLLQDIQQKAGDICYQIYQFLDCLSKSCDVITRQFEIIHNDLNKQKWSRFIIKDNKLTESYASVPDEEDVALRHGMASTNYRSRDDATWTPLLFLDVHSKVYSPLDPDYCSVSWYPEFLSYLPNRDMRKKGLHLIVIAHGFQGNSSDIRNWKNYINLTRPDAILLSSTSNEEDTDSSISDMGLKLYNEIIQYIQEYCPKGLRKISFIGYGLGGLIIRSALPHLSQFSCKMQFLITIATPHLGFMQNSSKLVDARMLQVHKWRNSDTLKQLAMADANNITDTFIYKLSSEPGLEWFKHVCFMSSYQDNFTPYESARVEISKKTTSIPLTGHVFLEMALNITERFRTERLHRIDVDFRIGESTDPCTSHSAHVQLVENACIVQMFLHSCAYFFE